MARAARPSHTRHGDYVGSPGRVPNSAPARRPPPVQPRPAAFRGLPCRPPNPPQPFRSRGLRAKEVEKPGEGARKFCSEFRGCCGRGSPRYSPLLQHVPVLTYFLPPKAHGLEGVPGTRWLSTPCTAARAHLGRGPAGSGRPTRRSWAERAPGWLRPPPGGPREGRGVSSSLPGGGEGREREETAGRGRWGLGQAAAGL